MIPLIRGAQSGQLHRQKANRGHRLGGARGQWGLGVWWDSVCVWDDEKVLETDCGGGGHTTL